MHSDARITDLITAPKARWALAWLAAHPAEHPVPCDSFDAAARHPRHTRLHTLRDNPAGLLAEVHTRVARWTDDAADHHAAVDKLGPPDGYRRIATALVNCVAARWWWQPLDRTAQTWICDDPDIPATIDDVRHTSFGVSYGHHPTATAPADPTKPVRAAITSTQLPGLPATDLLHDQRKPYYDRTPATCLTAWDIRIADTADVFEITGPHDWTHLVARYPSHRTNACLNTAIDTAWPPDHPRWTPEWRQIARDYAGVRLTVAGWLTATSRILTVPGKGLTFCEGWPTERTYWFRPAFEKFTRLPSDRLEYGYGRAAAGAAWDLTDTPTRPQPRWHKLFPRLRSPR